MPRKVKCRKVCHYPQTLEFLPQNNNAEQEPIVLTVDEYEAIRLIDRRGMSQEQCAAFMQIARTTVQRIYETARKKLAGELGIAGYRGTAQQNTAMLKLLREQAKGASHASAGGRTAAAY